MLEVPKVSPLSRKINSAFLLLEKILPAGLFRLFLKKSQHRYRKSLEKKLARFGASEKVYTVERREGLDTATFQREYLSASKPVIFSGAAKSWACCQRWNLDYFSQDHGDNDLLMVNIPGVTTSEKHFHHQFLALHELIKNIRNGGEKYLRFSPLLDDNPELAAHLDTSWLAEKHEGDTFGNTYYMFIGGAGHKTLMHTDQPCNLYVQVYGEKKWTLFFQEDTPLLYPEITELSYVSSPIDVNSPDHEKYPLFKYARRVEAHLKPGDVMYIPPHVWHYVENLSESIAVAYRFSSVKAALRSSVTFSLLRVLSTNPPIWKMGKYGKMDTNLIFAYAGGKLKEVMAQRAARRNKVLQKRAADREHAPHSSV